MDSTPRYYNVYGQKKWEKIRSIVYRMKSWSPYIMSFDNSNRHSYIYRLERTDMINSTYFTEILTYKPNPSDYSQPSDDVEQQSSRYVQAGVFKNSNEDFDKYFMIINRRCSPYYPDTPSIENGGRFIKLKLDSNHSEMTGFNNWCIFDLENDSLIGIFNKNIVSTVNLGWYLPGEGKLYKLAPVMQEGGMLVADENCGGFSFDCKAGVYNNGKNIRIKPGTTINFTNDSARIVMNDGSFVSGTLPSIETAPVYLKGKDGTPWHGILLEGCDSVYIAQTYFENISPYPVSIYATSAATSKLYSEGKVIQMDRRS